MGNTNKIMSSRDWKLDINELRSKITSKSKIIVFNTPHNPVGKVFSIEEMAEINKLAEEFNLIIISDEVVCEFQIYFHFINENFLSHL